MKNYPIIIALAFLFAAGCGQNVVHVPAPDFTAPLPPVAAHYRTEVTEPGSGRRAVEWRFWRDKHRIERENLDAGTGEIWQRDGATLFHTRVFHSYRKGIEYQPGDLAMLGAGPQWIQQALIVSPELLDHLETHSTRERDGIAYRRYKGTYADAQWDITLRLDTMLPQSITRRQGDRTERIELHDVYALAQAPWMPTQSREYDMIDFADLGDRERDPFVLALQRSEGTLHAQAH